MKQVVFYVLAAGLVLGSGCSKKEEPSSTKVIPKEIVAKSAPVTSAKATEIVPVVAAQAQAVIKEVEQKVQAATAQTQTAVKEVTQKAQAVTSALTVKPEAVMAELNQPIADIKAKVAGYGKPELLAYANAYKDVILSNKEQLTGLTGKLKELGMTELIGEKGKALKAELTKYTSQLAGLKERYSVYLDMLKKFGVDTASFGL